MLFSYGIIMALLSACSLDNAVKGQFGMTDGVDPRPKLSVSSSQVSVIENGGLAILSLLDSAPEEDIVINWSISGGSMDFTETSGSVTIAAGDTSGVISLFAQDDSIFETTKNYSLILESEGVSEEVVVNIVLEDNDSPVPNPSMTLSDPTTSSVTYIRQNSVDVSITGDGTVTKWCVSETQITPPASFTSPCVGGAGTDSGWHTVRPTSLTVSAPEGNKVFYIWVAEASGNISLVSTTDSITLDKDAPATSTLTLSDTVSGSASQAYSNPINIGITGDLDADQYCVFDQDSVSPAPPTPVYSDACWSTIKPTVESLESVGDRTVFLFTKDLAQNVSLITSADITFSLNSAPVASNDTISVMEGDGSIQAIDVLVNDLDLEGETKSITAKTDGSQGEVTITGGGSGLNYTLINLSFHGVDSFTYTVSDPRGASSVGTVYVKVMTPFTWTGNGAGDSWSTTGNWCGSVTAGSCVGGPAPGGGQLAVFDGTCTTNCNSTIDISITVGGVEMLSAYGGTITQAPGSLVTLNSSSGFLQQSGTYIGGDSNFSNNGPFQMTGGNFTSTTGSYIHTTSNAFNVSGGATFSHNNGQVQFSQTLSVTNGSTGFYNVQFLAGCGSYTDINVNGTIDIFGQLDVNLCFAKRVMNGTLNLHGDVILTGLGGGNSLFNIVGNSNQTIMGTLGEEFHRVTIASTGGTVTLSGNIEIEGNFTYSSGVVDGGNSTVKFRKNANWGLTVNSGAMAFNHVIFDAVCSHFSTINVTGVIKVLGDFTLDLCSPIGTTGGTIEVGGNLTMIDNKASSSTGIVLNGTGVQNVTHTAGPLPTGQFEINKASGSVVLNSALPLTNTGQDLLITAGILDLNGNTLTVDDFLTIDTGGTLNVNGGVYTPNSLPKLINNGTIIP